MAIDPPYRLDPIKNIVNVGWGKGFCGIIAQIGRWRTGFFSTWFLQVFDENSPVIDGGQHSGNTANSKVDPFQWDYPSSSNPQFTKLAFNMPLWNPVLEGEFGIAGNSAARAVVFNYHRQAMALGRESIPNEMELTLRMSTSFGDNSSQWHFMFDTFRLVPKPKQDPNDPNEKLDVFDPTFTQGAEPDSEEARVGIETIGQAPVWIPTTEILDTARMIVPHTNSLSQILFQAEIKARFNTRTGKFIGVDQTV